MTTTNIKYEVTLTENETGNTNTYIVFGYENETEQSLLNKLTLQSKVARRTICSELGFTTQIKSN